MKRDRFVTLGPRIKSEDDKDEKISKIRTAIKEMRAYLSGKPNAARITQVALKQTTKAK